MAASSPRRKKSKHDDLIKNLITYGATSVLLIVFAVMAYTRGSIAGLLAYAATVFVAFAVAFLGVVFIPWGSRWVQLGFWGLLVSLPIVISLKGYGGGWLFGYLVGLLAAVTFARKRHKRETKTQFGDRVLVTVPTKQRKPLTASLTVTGFREALAQLDNELRPAITLLTEGKRLDVYGTAAGPLVVYGTLEAGNDFAWRRLSTPGLSDPDSEITVPVGNLNGVYRKQSTVDAKLAKQAGEFFIRNGELDPSLTWEEGQDVLDRLPPTRFRV